MLASILIGRAGELFWRLALLVFSFLLVLPAQAATLALFDEDFQKVTFAEGTTERAVSNVLKYNRPQISGKPITRSVGGEATQGAFDVRKASDPINGLGNARKTFGDATFDSFFGSNFLVIGDISGELGGDSNGQPNPKPGALATATMQIGFTLPALPSDADFLDVSYSYVFDANSLLNGDDFRVFVVLSGGRTYVLQDFGAPSAQTRGAFNQRVPLSALSGRPTALAFYLFEENGGGSSAVGVDDIKVNVISNPEPASLLLLGTGLVVLARFSRKRTQD